MLDVEIEDPQPLTVYSRNSTNKQQVSYNLTGGNVYNVTHNGYTKQIQSNSVDIKLKKGLNTIVIDTGLDCQGAFFKQYFNSSEVVLAPNPAKEESYLYVGGDDPQVQITVFTTLEAYYKAKYDWNKPKSTAPNHEWAGSYYLKVEGQPPQASPTNERRSMKKGQLYRFYHRWAIRAEEGTAPCPRALLL